MSVVALVVDPLNGITLAADGIRYDQNGRFTGPIQKSLAIVHLGCMIAAVGMGRQIAVTFDLIDRGLIGHPFTSFDELVGAFPVVFRTAIDVLRSELTPGEESEAQMILAGWSAQQGRFEAWRICNYRKPVRVPPEHRESPEAVAFVGKWGFEPFHMDRIDDFYSTTFMTPELVGAIDLRRKSLTLPEYLVRVIKAARSTSRNDPGDVFAVGGFIQMTELNRETVSSWIAHRWPDEIGAVIASAG